MNITTSEEIIAKSRGENGDGGVGVGVRVLTCVGCRSTINDQYILQVSPDLEWHVECLRCNECHQPLDEQKTCFVRNGKTYCKADYLRLFGIKCVGCRLGFKMSDLVMRTRHRIFHLDCFRCSICRRRLVPGDEYAIDDDHDPIALYCRHDYDAACIRSCSPSSSSVAGLPPPLTQDALLPLSPSNNNDDNRATTTNDDVTSDNNNDLKTTTNENCLSSSPHHNTSTTSNSNSSNSNSASGPAGGGATGMMMLKSTGAVAMAGKRGGGGTGGSRSGGGSVGGGGSGGGRTVHTKSSDHHHQQHPKTTRVRTVLNEKQLHTLRTCYAANPRPDALMKDQLVEMTGLSSRVIRVWFQNKRCKDKKRTILIKQIQQQQQQHNDKLHGGGVPLIATSPVQHDPSSSLIQSNPIEIHRFIQHHHQHSTSSSSWNSISSSVASSLAAAAAAATSEGGGGGQPYDPLNQPPLQISTSDARDPGQGQAPSSQGQGQGHVMASFQQLLSSFGESDDDDTVVSLEETSAAAAAGLQGSLTPGLHPPPPLLPPISIGAGGGTQPPAAAASVALASRVAMQRIARFSNDLHHLHHPSRLSIHHHPHHHHHHHQHQQQQQQHLISQTPPPSVPLPPHLFNNASITNNSSSSSSNFISTATHLIQQSTLKAFDTKC